MSPHTFATSPAARGEQRKFTNVTPGFCGANIFGPDGHPTSIAVEPHGEVWLTAEEERMTAEAPRRAQDNPFVKTWEEPVALDPFGEPTATVTREGVLVASEEPPRPIASDRFIPPRTRAVRDSDDHLGHVEQRLVSGGTLEGTDDPETITGAPPLARQPPVQGQRSPAEVLGTPAAPNANDETIARRRPTPEQPTRSPAPKAKA
jgi:hypothetical protein